MKGYVGLFTNTSFFKHIKGNIQVPQIMVSAYCCCVLLGNKLFFLYNDECQAIVRADKLQATLQITLQTMLDLNLTET